MDCYSRLFLLKVAPDFFHDALRLERLLAAGFRHCLILHAVDKMARRAVETTQGPVVCRRAAAQSGFFLPPHGASRAFRPAERRRRRR